MMGRWGLGETDSVLKRARQLADEEGELQHQHADQEPAPAGAARLSPRRSLPQTPSPRPCIASPLDHCGSSGSWKSELVVPREEACVSADPCPDASHGHIAAATLCLSPFAHDRVHSLSPVPAQTGQLRASGCEHSPGALTIGALRVSDDCSEAVAESNHGSGRKGIASSHGDEYHHTRFPLAAANRRSSRQQGGDASIDAISTISACKRTQNVDVTVDQERAPEPFIGPSIFHSNLHQAQIDAHGEGTVQLDKHQDMEMPVHGQNRVARFDESRKTCSELSHQVSELQALNHELARQLEKIGMEKAGLSNENEKIISEMGRVMSECLSLKRSQEQLRNDNSELQRKCFEQAQEINALLGASFRPTAALEVEDDARMLRLLRTKKREMLQHHTIDSLVPRAHLQQAVEEQRQRERELECTRQKCATLEAQMLYRRDANQNAVTTQMQASHEQARKIDSCNSESEELSVFEQCRADTIFSSTGCHGREGLIACQTTASETATKKCVATPAVEVRDQGEAKSTAEHPAVEAVVGEIPQDVGQENRQVEEACPHHEQVKSTHAEQRTASVTDVPIQDVKDMAKAYHQGYLHYQAHRSLRASLHIGPGAQKKIQHRHEVKGVERGTRPKHQLLLQRSKALAPSADFPRGPENVLAHRSVGTALGADLADVGRVQGSEPAGQLPFLQEWLDSKRALSEDAALLESSGLLEVEASSRRRCPLHSSNLDGFGQYV